MIGVIIKKPIDRHGTSSIELTNEELAIILQLRDHYADIVTMREAGVFDFKNGHAIIHRDHEGKLRKIDVNLTLYRS